MAVGKGMSTKINANIGTSQLINNLDQEIEKLRACEKYGADAVMDLSTGGDLDAIRKLLLSKTRLAFGTVPIYQLMCEKKSDFSAKDLLDIIRKHCEQGVDFITVHCGVTKEVVSLLKNIRALPGWSAAAVRFWPNGYRKPDRKIRCIRILTNSAILPMHMMLHYRSVTAYDPVVLPMLTTRVQIKELEILGKLTKRAWKKGVQVIVEGRVMSLTIKSRIR